jgi:hypothetical protein
MNRRALPSWIIGGVIFVALVFLLVGNLERETVQIKGQMSLEALRNPRLATERLLARMGRKTQRLENSLVLDSLPEGGVLILLGRRENLMDEARANNILDWVARGGYLILERNRAEKDPLLLPFGVTDEVNTTEKPGIVRHERAGDSSLPFIEARLPGDAQRYRLSFNDRTIKPGEKTPPLWRVENQYGSIMLHYAWERGHVTVMSRLDFLDNDELGDFDHAEFFWALLQRYQPKGPIRFVTRMEFPTLWQWLSTTAWRVLPSVAVLILLWLFWVVPRFGGVRAAPEAERRGLSEHLLALGRCLWREGAVGSLLNTARREIAYRLAQRHPQLLRLSAEERSQALARKSGLPATEIDAALHSDYGFNNLDDFDGFGDAPLSQETFTRAMQTAQNLEHIL